MTLAIPRFICDRFFTMKAWSTLLLLPTFAIAQIANPPTRFGVMLFPAFQALDVFGPLDVLNTIYFSYPNITLSVLARTLNPVSTTPITMNTTFGQTVVPTHTFAAPPSDLEVLVVPGGLGTRNPDLQPEIDFIRTIFPSVRYVIAVCTGNALVAKAGLLDGKKATGNKKSWTWLTAQSDKVHWVAKARWVVSSPKIWSTSGISSGVDGTLDWVEQVYGKEAVTTSVNHLEWRRVTDPNQDEFADLWGAKDVLPVA
ncbi:DJ-1/PfpI family protein [Coprinopsis sp. MPI-PUGE-AT-0042]|nr:DJ-1/PfpI family protein [Coprinopsis sp. MPI-PUGE-AT-0042]